MIGHRIASFVDSFCTMQVPRDLQCKKQADSKYSYHLKTLTIGTRLNQERDVAETQHSAVATPCSLSKDEMTEKRPAQKDTDKFACIVWSIMAPEYVFLSLCDRRYEPRR